MNFNKVSRLIGKTSLFLKKNSPAIATTIGIAAGCAAFAFGIKKAMELPSIVAEYKEDISDADGDKALEEAVKRKALFSMIKTMAIPVGLQCVSVAAIAYSHTAMAKRYKGAMIAYSGLTATLAAFEKRVLEGEGLEKFRKYRYGITKEEVAYSTTDENGEETVAHEQVEHIDKTFKPGMYSRWFDDNCPDWSTDPAANRAFLLQKQRWFTDKLSSRGYLWLNEVLKELGFKETEVGWQVGWVYDEENPVGDNFVDFGIFTEIDGKIRGYIDRENNRWLLVFNVDGPLYGLPQLRKYGVEEY